MKAIFSNNSWIIVGASFALLGLGLIQINWIVQARELKKEQIHRQLKKLSDEIAVNLEISENFEDHKIVSGEEPVPLDTIAELVSEVLNNAGISETAYYSIYQEKKEGLFQSNQKKLENDLRNSPYKTCLSCIMTIRYLSDTLKPVTPEMTFIRSVSEMEKLPGGKQKEDFLWFSFFIPNQEKLTNEAILGLFILTLFLMILLIGLFTYVLNSLAKQKKLNQVKDDFFNNMTHEFKTPLGSIFLASRVLRTEPTKEKQNSYLDLIENETKKLENQVDKILQLSMIDSGEMSFEKEDVELNNLIEEVIQRLKLIIEQKGAHIEFNLNLENDFIQGDKGHLSNAIYNLVENALKYSGKRPRIQISAFEQNGKKIISIKDHGVGISNEHHPEIFDRFYRAQKNDQYKGKGFGIGLSYVKAVVESHGGSIILESEINKGAEFIITF